VARTEARLLGMTLDLEPSWPPVIACRICGGPLLDDPDDQPDHPLGPQCGACSRAREFDQTLWERDLQEGRDRW
jgi:hypothetical protein